MVSHVYTVYGIYPIRYFSLSLLSYLLADHAGDTHHSTLDGSFRMNISTKLVFICSSIRDSTHSKNVRTSTFTTTEGRQLMMMREKSAITLCTTYARQQTPATACTSLLCMHGTIEAQHQEAL